MQTIYRKINERVERRTLEERIARRLLSKGWTSEAPKEPVKKAKKAKKTADAHEA